MRRLIRLLPLIIPLALLLGCAAVTARRLASTSEQVRKLVVIELSRALQEPVEVGRVSGSVLGKVRLEDVVVGRNENLPGGAVFATKSLTVGVKWREYLRGEAEPANLITALELNQPQLLVTHDSDGHWNVHKWLRKRHIPRRAFGFRGRVVVRSGVLHYQDDFLAQRAGEPLRARLTDIDGAIQFAGEGPVRWSGTVRGGDRFTRAEVTGVAPIQGGAVNAAVRATDADAAYFQKFFLPSEDYRVESGRTDADLVVTYGALKDAARFSVAGDLRLRDAVAFAPPLAPRRLERISGAVSFANRHIELKGVRAQLGATRATVTGTYTSPTDASRRAQPQFDLEIDSPSAALTELIRLGDPRGEKAHGLRLLTDTIASGRVRLTGNLQDVTLSGAVHLGAAAVEHPTYGVVALQPFALRFGTPSLAGADFAAELTSPDINLARLAPDKLSPHFSGVALSRLMHAALRITGFPSQPLITGAVRMPTLKLGGVELQNVTAEARYHQGFLHLQGVRAEVGGGVACGEVQLALSDDASDGSVGPALGTRATFDRVEAGALQSSLGSLGMSMDGALAGELIANGTPQHLSLELKARSDHGRLHWMENQERRAAALQKLVASFSGNVKRDGQATKLEGEFSGLAEALDAPTGGPRARRWTARHVALGAQGELTLDDGGATPRGAGLLSVRQLHAELARSETTVAAEPRDLVVEDLSGAFVVDDEGTQLTNLRARALAANWRANLSLPVAGEPRGEFSADNVDLEAVAQWLDQPGVSGQARVRGSWRGALEAPRVDAEVEARNVSTPWIKRPLRLARVAGEWRENSLHLREAIAWSRGTRLELSGELDDIDLARGDARVQLTAAITGGDVRDLLTTFDQKLEAEGLVNATLSVNGTWLQPHATGRVEITRGLLFGIVVDHADARGRYQNGLLEIAEARGQFGDATFEIAGTHHAQRGTHGRWALTHAPASVVAQALGLKASAHGRLSASGTLAGRFPDEQVGAGLSLAGLSLQGRRFGDLTAAVRVDRRRLLIDEAWLRSNGQTRWMHGVLPWSSEERALDVTLQLARESVDELMGLAEVIEQVLRANGVAAAGYRGLLDQVRGLPPLKGAISAEARLTGAWEQPRVDLRGVRVAQLQIGGESLPNIKEADLSWDCGRFVLHRFLAEGQGERLEVRDDSYWSPTQIDLGLKAEGLALRHLRPFVAVDRAAEGKVRVFLLARGSAAAPDVDAEVEATELRYPWLPLDRVQARFHVRENELNMKDGELVIRRSNARKGRANVLLCDANAPVSFQPLALVRDREIEVTLRAEPQEFNFDNEVLPDLDHATGRLAGKLTLTGTLDNPHFNGGLTLHDVAASVRGLLRVSDVNATLQLDENTNTLRLHGASGRFELGTPVAPRPTRNPVLRLVSENPSPTLGPARFDLSGTTQLDPDHLTDWRAHRYDLQLQFSGGRWSLPQLNGLHDLSGKLRLVTRENNGHRLSIESVSARDGEELARGLDKGRLVVDGTVDIQRPANGTAGRPRNGASPGATDDFWQATRLNVGMRISDFVVRQANVLTATLNGDLKLVNDPGDSRPLLKGDLAIPTGLARGFPQSAPLPARLPAVPRFDLVIALGKDVRIANVAFEGQLDGSGTLKGTPSRPEAAFQFAARRGNVLFPGAALRVTSATTTLNVTRDALGNLSPLLNVNLRAEGKLDRYQVIFTIHGPLELNAPGRQIPWQLETYPPMDSNEKYTRLLGLPPDKVGERQQQIAGEHVLAIFQAPLVSGLTEEIRRAIGLEVFGVDYKVGQPTSIQFGKELTRNLFVLYRKQVAGTTELNTMRFEYRIRGRLLLGYQTDERERILSLDASFRF